VVNSPFLLTPALSLSDNQLIYLYYITMQSRTITWKGDTNGIYEINYKRASDANWEIPPVSPVKGLSATIDGLEDDTTYVFRVREYCPAGPVSTWLFYTYKTPAAECVAPTGVKTTNITETTVDVSWTASESAIGGYYVEYKQDGVNTWLISSIISATTHYALTGLTSGIGYQVRVKSICSNGGQATSSAVSFDTLAVKTQCADIQAGSVSITTNGSSYVATYTNTGGTPSTHTLEYSVDNGQSWGQVQSVFNQTTTSAVYALPSAVGIFPVSHKLRVTPKCADGSLGQYVIGNYISDSFTQFITIQNALDAGSTITGIRIDGNPNILNTAILSGATKNWNQDGLLGNAHSINAYLGSVNNGTVIKTTHLRSGTSLWNGTAVYNGGAVPLITSRVLADHDIIKVERQSITAISGFIRVAVDNHNSNCHTQGLGSVSITLNQSFAQPIVLQFAYITVVPTTEYCSGAGGDIIPVDDHYNKRPYVDNTTWYPAQVTIPANQSFVNTTGGGLYTQNSFVFLSKNGRVLELDPTGDYSAEHGQLMIIDADCNRSTGSYLLRLYYKVISPFGLVNLNLVAVDDDVKASRITLVKL
jgi:hypothetical protein